MSIIAWIILGGLAGWIASLLMHTDGSQGIFLNVVVGVIGAALGGFLFNVMGAEGVTGFNLYSMLVAVLGAVALLWLVKLVRAS